jgi:AraC-like DNA-binding protein
LPATISACDEIGRGSSFLGEIVIKARKTSPQKLSWLMEADELGPRLSDSAPIFVKLFEQKTAAEAPGPARHPYCEINVSLKGEGIVMVEGEETRRAVNDVMLLGPGVPHWGKVTKYPHRAITVYFLPSALLEFCNPQVSVSILRRFSAPRSLGERLVRLSPDMHRALVRGLSEIHEEFRGRGFGWELRVGAILFSEIVRLMRWEASRGAKLGEDNSDVDWRPVVQALRYLRENYAEQIYAADVAQAAGISETRLKLVFRRAVGMPWVKYLQIYRTHRAALLLCEGKMNVTEVALGVGFESLSHFNSTFRAIMGQTPSEYARQNHRPQTGRAKRSSRRRR